MRNIIIAAVVIGLVAAVGIALAQTNRQEGEPAPAMTNNQQEVQKKDIVDTAIEAGSFTTLVQAIQAAGLEATLRSEGPFTVFAPTDEAFAKLPAETLEAVLNDQEMLTSILTYHVVSGKVMAADVVGLDAATTVQGSQVNITVNGNDVHVNDAQVIATDIEASNGVIHVIDTVLIPQ
jgi:uncharacterized surface protein with fasciclin (FAS1) repeats